MIKIISLLFFLFISCNHDKENSTIVFKDLDILENTKISISQGNQRIVDVVAKKLFKDEIHIYLKGNYDSLEVDAIRNKLTLSMMQNPIYSRIIKLAESVHINNGNIKAKFYNQYNDLNSILYADSSRINNRYNNMIAEGNVVIYSPTTNLMLLGNKVLWNNKAKRILSEENVTILKMSDEIHCIQKSVGFESDMDLSNYIFYNIAGQINEDCF